jgi:hypothetical protein
MAIGFWLFVLAKPNFLELTLKNAQLAKSFSRNGRKGRKFEE